MRNQKIGREFVLDFWRERRVLLLGIFLFLLLFYGGRIFQANVSIDSEYIINHPGSYYNWMELGRFGQCFTKWLLHMGWYNPYFQNMVFLISLWLFAAVMCCLMDRFCEVQSAGILFLFAALTLTHPCLAEQSYFIMQRAEIGVGYLYTGLSLLLTFAWIKETKWYLAVLAVIPAVLAFATYQSFVVIYVAGAAGSYLLYCRRAASGRWCLIQAGRILAVFFLSMVCYMAVEKLLCGDSTYLGAMVAWGALPFKTCVKQILAHLWKLLTGADIHYSRLQGLFMERYLFVFSEKRGCLEAAADGAGGVGSGICAGVSDSTVRQ